MLCVVAHDTGGAELLASYIARHGPECQFVLSGPAVRVFERRLGVVALTSLERALDECEEFLCGTGWQSDLEWRAIGAAHAAGKPTTAFLDHWSNYRERFVRQGIEHLPDTILVGDPLAEKMAKANFPDLEIRLVPNPYFEDIQEELARIRLSFGNNKSRYGIRVLFVCEPLSEHGLKEYGNERHWGYTEFDALRYFFLNRHVVDQEIASIIVRPHPSEPEGKYNGIVSEFGKIASVGGRKPLLEEIAESDVVVGCESMAMVVGLVAGCRVISCIPPGGNPCGLPQPEIELMQDLLKLND